VREDFPGYVRPRPEELEEWVRTGLIVLDANVLLDFYRISPTARDQLMGVLEALGDRLWVPHQALLEFHRNRVDVIREQQVAIDKLRAAVDKARSAYLDAITTHAASRPTLQDVGGQMRELATERLSTLGDELVDLERGHWEALGPGNLLDEDPIYDRLEGLMQGRYGEAYDQDRLEAIYVEGKQRYADKVPPGYMDGRDKPEPDRYGDLILWLQTIDEAKTRQLPVIFLSRDDKEDWLKEASGQKIGPRPELVAEMRRQAGVPFYRYSARTFAERAEEWLGTEISDATLSELKDIALEPNWWQTKLLSDVDDAVLDVLAMYLAPPDALERVARGEEVVAWSTRSVIGPGRILVQLRLWLQRIESRRIFCRVTGPGYDDLQPASLNMRATGDVLGTAFPDDFVVPRFVGVYGVEWLAEEGNNQLKTVAGDHFTWDASAASGLSEAGMWP